MWKRPENVEFPQVWHRFKGRRPMPDGTIPSFRVQDLTPDYYERAVEFMFNDFIYNEPLCKATCIKNDPASIQEMKDLWLRAVPERTAIICFREDPDDSDKVFPEIVGLNMTIVSSKDSDEKLEMKNKAFATVMNSVIHCSKLVDPFEMYNVDAYLGAMGLTVAAPYKGQNIGAEILKARIPLCKAVGLKLTVTVFTAIESQVLARKVGFEEIGKISYKELAKLYGEDLLNSPVQDCYLMALKID